MLSGWMPRSQFRLSLSKSQDHHNTFNVHAFSRRSCCIGAACTIRCVLYPCTEVLTIRRPYICVCASCVWIHLLNAYQVDKEVAARRRIKNIRTSPVNCSSNGNPCSLSNAGYPFLKLLSDFDFQERI